MRLTIIAVVFTGLFASSAFASPASGLIDSDILDGHACISDCISTASTDSCSHAFNMQCICEDKDLKDEFNKCLTNNCGSTELENVLFILETCEVFGDDDDDSVAAPAPGATHV